MRAGGKTKIYFKSERRPKEEGRRNTLVYSLGEH
jgi:hypothetical protein